MLVGTLRAELSLDTSAFLASMKQAIANAKSFNSNIVQEVAIDSTKAESQIDRLGILFDALKKELASTFSVKVDMNTEGLKHKAEELYKFIDWLRKGTEGPPALIKVDIDTSLMKNKAQELYRLIEWLRKGTESGPALIKVDLDTGTMSKKANELYKFIQWIHLQASIPHTIKIDADTSRVEYEINKLGILLTGLKEMTSAARVVRVSLDLENFAQQLNRFGVLYEGLKNTVATPLSARINLEFESLKQGSENLTSLVQNLSGQVSKPITLTALLDTTQFDAASEELIDLIDILHDQAAKPVTLKVSMKDTSKAKEAKQSVEKDAQGFKKSADYIKQAGQNAASASQNFAKASTHIKSTEEVMKETAKAVHKTSAATKELGKETAAAGKQMTKSLGKEPQKEVEETTKTIQNSTWTIRGYIKDLSRVITGILMSQMFYTILRGIKDTIAEAYNLRQEFERMAISFKYLLGITTEQAQRFSSQMREWGLATEFSIMGAANAFRQLLFAGVELKNMNSAMYVITGTASALGLELEEVVGTMLQIQAATTVSTSELRRLARMGYPIGRILREQLHLTSEDLQDINELKIPGDVMFKALIVGLQDFGEAGQEAAGTIRALASDIVETFKDIVQLSFDNVLDNWRDFLERTLKIVALVRKEILSIGIRGIGKVMPPQLKEELLIIRASFLAIWDAIKILSKSLKSILGYSLKDLMQIFSRIIPILANLLHTFASFVQQVINSNPHIRALVGSLVGLGVANIVVGVFKALINVLVKFGIIKVVTSLFHGLAKAFAASWKWGLALIAIIGVGIALLMSNAKTVQGYIQGVTQSIVDAFGSFSDAGKLPEQTDPLEDIEDSWGNIKDGIDDATEAFKPFLAAFDEVYNIPTQAEEVSNEWEKLADALKWPEYELPEYNWEDFNLWSWIPFDSWQGSWDNFWAGLKTAPQRLLAWWNTTAWPAVKSWLSNTGEKLSTWWKELPGNIANWLEEKIHIVADWFTTLPGKVREWLTENAPTIHDVTQWLANLPSLIGEWFRTKLEQFFINVGLLFTWGGSEGAQQIIEDLKTIITNGFKTFVIVISWAFAEIGSTIQTFIDSILDEIQKWAIFIGWHWDKAGDALKKFTDETGEVPLVYVVKWIWQKFTDPLTKFKDDTGMSNLEIIQTVVKWIFKPKTKEEIEEEINEENKIAQIIITIGWAWEKITDAIGKFIGDTEEGLPLWYVPIKWAWIKYGENKKKFEEETESTNIIQFIKWAFDGNEDGESKFAQEHGMSPFKYLVNWGFDTLKTPIQAWDDALKIWGERRGQIGEAIDTVFINWALKKAKKDAAQFENFKKDLTETFGIDPAVVDWVFAKPGDRIAKLYENIRSLVTSVPVVIDWAFTKISDNIKALKEAIAEAFRNFLIRINFKLPKIEYTMVKKNMGIFGEVDLPKFNIRWNKTGGIYDKESIVGLAENAKEAVIPLSGKEMRPFAQAIAQELRAENNKQGTGSTDNGGSPIVYVQYLIADERGLRELERRMRVVRLEEDLRGGLA